MVFNMSTVTGLNSDTENQMVAGSMLNPDVRLLSLKEAAWRANDQHGSSNGATWDSLPDSIAWKIFSLLPPGELFAASKVCKNWRKNVRDARLWPTMVVVQQVATRSMEDYCSLAFRYATTITEATLFLKSSSSKPSSATKAGSTGSKLPAEAISDHLTMTFKNWTSVDVEIQGPPLLQAAALGPLAKYCVNLRSLTICNLKTGSLGALALFRDCRNLTSVIINGSSSLSSSELCIAVASHFKRLLYLHVTSPPLDDAGLQAIGDAGDDIILALHFNPSHLTLERFADLGRFSNLRSLCLEYPPVKLINVYREAMKELKNLVVFRLTLLDTATPWVLGTISEEILPKLRHLHVTAAVFGDNFSEGLNIPCLRHLGMESTSNGRDCFTDTGLLRLFVKCPRLQFLYLGSLAHVSDDSMLWLNRGMLPVLKRLYLNAVPKVTVKGLRVLTEMRSNMKIVKENAKQIVYCHPTENEKTSQTKLLHEAWLCPDLTKIIRLAKILPHGPNSTTPTEASSGSATKQKIYAGSSRKSATIGKL